jgi:elongation factor P--(R)-beta-lysine ligase
VLDLDGLQRRAEFFSLIRQFFTQRGFLEVDTPLRQPLYIPESTIEPIPADGQYLQSSPEICMKRLLAAGAKRIFQICRCFRKGERGRYHLEEFQMLEWYHRGEDYRQLMADCQELLGFLAERLTRSRPDEGRGVFAGVALHPPWQRLTVAEAFAKYSPVPLDRALAEELFDEVLVEHVEPRLGRGAPLFLYDYPRQLASLAREKAGEPGVAERFELYINGIELVNGFSELTDALEQRRRLTEEIATIAARGTRLAVMPERFLEDLAGLDTAAGAALGVDRLFMVAMGYATLGEAVTFSPADLV